MGEAVRRGGDGPRESREDGPRCGVCGRPVVECAACQNDECPDIICYPDLAFVLGQSERQPHAHGG